MSAGDFLQAPHGTTLAAVLSYDKYWFETYSAARLCTISILSMFYWCKGSTQWKNIQLWVLKGVMQYT